MEVEGLFSLDFCIERFQLYLILFETSGKVSIYTVFDQRFQIYFLIFKLEIIVPLNVSYYFQDKRRLHNS